MGTQVRRHDNFQASPQMNIKGYKMNFQYHFKIFENK